MLQLPAACLMAVLVTAATAALAPLRAPAATLEWIQPTSYISQGAAVDNAGNVYTAGSSDVGATVGKYDPGGKPVWQRTSGPGQASAVSVDGIGNVYIAGFQWPSSMMIAKYDADGNSLWSHVRAPTEALTESWRHARAEGIAVDASGALYVSGHSVGSLFGPLQGYQDAFLSKYDIDGALLWSKQFGGGKLGEDEVRVAVGPSGHVYVAGRTYGLGGPTAGADDAFLRKYDSAGNVEWTRQLGSPKTDVVTGVAVDTLGNIFMLGTTYGSFFSPTGGPTGLSTQDVFLAKFNSSGDLLWGRQFGTTDRETSAGLGVDSTGNAYIDWHSTPQSVFDPTHFVTKYDSAGSSVWTQLVAAPGASGFGQSLAVDSRGNVYVAGGNYVAKISEVPEPGSIALIAIAAAAHPRWRRQGVRAKRSA